MSGFRLWLGFLAMCLGLFIAVLDVQVVASSLTAIGASLKIAPERLGWIQTGYLKAEVMRNQGGAIGIAFVDPGLQVRQRSTLRRWPTV